MSIRYQVWCGEATVHFECASFVLEDNAFILMVLNMV